MDCGTTTTERNKEPDLIEAHASWAQGPRISGGAKRRRLHDVRNACLSMKHDVAMQAANEMVLKEMDKY